LRLILPGLGREAVIKMRGWSRGTGILPVRAAKIAALRSAELAGQTRCGPEIDRVPLPLKKFPG